MDFCWDHYMLSYLIEVLLLAQAKLKVKYLILGLILWGFFFQNANSILLFNNYFYFRVSLHLFGGIASLNIIKKEFQKFTILNLVFDLLGYESLKKIESNYNISNIFSIQSLAIFAFCFRPAITDAFAS